MRAYARKVGGDEELWGVVGLLHDFDYDKYPSLEDHPYKGAEILKERGYSEEYGMRSCLMRSTRGFPAFLRWRRHCLPAMSWRDLLPLARW